MVSGGTDFAVSDLRPRNSLERCRRPKIGQIRPWMAMEAGPEITGPETRKAARWGALARISHTIERRGARKSAKVAVSQRLIADFEGRPGIDRV